MLLLVVLKLLNVRLDFSGSPCGCCRGSAETGAGLQIKVISPPLLHLGAILLC